MDGELSRKSKLSGVYTGFWTDEEIAISEVDEYPLRDLVKIIAAIKNTATVPQTTITSIVVLLIAALLSASVLARSMSGVLPGVAGRIDVVIPCVGVTVSLSPLFA